MQEPIKHIRVTRREPGRRYVSHAPLARAGGDIHAPHRGGQASQPQLPKPSQAPEVTNSRKSVPRQVSKVRPAMARTKRSMVLRRQMVERAKEQKAKVKKERNLHFLWYIFALAVIGAFCVVVWSFREALPFDLEFFKQKNEVINSVEPVSKEMATLDESPVSAAEIEANVVAGDVPKTLKIPSLQISARIRQVGTTLSGEPIAPKNINDVGWYEGSSRPGNDGAVLLNGHLAGPTKTGIFTDIQALHVGDEIVVQRGDGQSTTYAVERIQEYTGGQIDMSAAISSVDPTKKGLNLVTTLNKFSGTEKRIIVFAVQQDR